jgi:cytochrome b
MTSIDSDMVEGRATRPQTMKVWDVAVRLFHWSLVAAMAYEFLFRAGTDTHNTLGYVVLGLVGFRIVWGFTGTRHARFADFVKSPLETLRYIASMLRGHPARFIGHKPAGAAMVLALLAMIILTAGSGWAMTTDALWGEEWIEELHEGAANLTLALIAFHVLGVILASWQHRENLFRAMLTGRKSV